MAEALTKRHRCETEGRSAVVNSDEPTQATKATVAGEEARVMARNPSFDLTIPLMSSVRLPTPPSSAGPVFMPCVGLGTFRAKGATLQKAVALALQIGVALVDTAEGYKNAADVAAGIAKGGQQRCDVFVVSKVSKESMTKAKVASCVAAQAALLGGYIDLMLLHWPGTANSNPQSRLHAAARVECWDALCDALLETKLVRAIGVSNFTVAHLQQLKSSREGGWRVKPAVNQIEAHPFLPQHELRAFCAAEGIVVQAYTSLGRSTEPPRCLYGNWEPDLPRLVKNGVVLAVAKEVGKSPEQVLLRWALQSGMCVVPKAVTPEHVRENANLGGFELSAAHMAALASIDAHGTIVYAYRPEKVPV